MKDDHKLTLTDVTILGNFFEISVTNDFSPILEYNQLDNHCNSNLFKQILYAIHWGYALHLNPTSACYDNFHTISPIQDRLTEWSLNVFKTWL